MQRNHLEISLTDAINRKQIAVANALIDIFLSYTGEPAPNLASIDDQGRNFLYLSLIAGTESITDRLLDLQQADDNIIFSKTLSQQRTLFWEAVNQTNYKVLKKLFSIVNSKPAEHVAHQFWIQAVDDGSTPLHCAILTRSEKLVKLILRQIKKHKTPRIVINQADNVGDTALHCALKIPTTSSIIGMLLDKGSSLVIPNDKNETPFSLFLLRSIDYQVNIIKAVKEKIRKDLLVHYKSEVYKNPENEILKKNYFICASLVSLKELMIAHHEFNPAIPVRHLFSSLMPSKPNPKKLEKVIDSLFNADGIVEQIPTFAKKLVAMEKAQPIFLFDSDTSESLTIIPDQIQLLSEDKKILNKLIDEINLFIIELESRPHHFSRLALILFFINLAIYLIIETALILITVFFEDIYHEPPYKPRPDNWGRYDCNIKYPQSRYCKYNALFLDYILADIFFGALGGAEVVSFLISFCCCCLNIKSPVLKEEWQLLVNDLNEDVFAKLSVLKESESPTQQSKIQQLESLINSLQNSRSPTEIISIFTEIKSNLIDIRKDIHLSSKPFTLFHRAKPTVIDIPSIEEGLRDFDDEAIPLLTM